MHYSINGNTAVNETYSSTLSSNNSVLFTFSTTANLSSVGNYTIKIWTTITNDSNTWNDTLTYTFSQLSNDSISLPYMENFEGSPNLLLTYQNIGVTGLTKFDYNNGGNTGRMRTAAGTRFYSGGNRAITLDKNTNSSGTVKNTLTLTLNMSRYDTSSRILLTYDIMQHGDEQHSGDSLWIRGADNKNWIKVRSILSGISEAGIYTTMPVLKLDSVLKANNQNFTSSFQIKFGQEDDSSARLVHLQDGISIDNINILEANVDLSLSNFSAPITDCNLTTTENVTVTVSNNTNAGQTSIPISYQINNNTPVTESITSLAGNTSTNYTFTTKANLNNVGVYSLKVWLGLSGDQYRNNDTISKSLRNIKLVSTFPYVENFETNNGDWYISSPSSWTWALPLKTIIDTSANGTKCWVTNSTSNYASNEFSVLNSACFDLSSFGSNPILSFNMINSLENTFDFAYIEYSENGTTWTKLGAQNQGVNWYNSNTNKWTNVDTPWQVSSITIPVSSMSNKSKVRFRWVLTSDGNTNDEGLAIDDINIFGSPTSIYGGTDSITATSNGAGWVDFNSGGNRIASINDNGNNLGSINCKVYKRSGSSRSKNGQYYMNRNWVLKPTTQPTSACAVRLWFTKAEMDSFLTTDP
ncbi:MAG: hypothetical protein HYZ42_17775, partial [Bacteroidetes bacterium]|nr:hypothetical protein [Bacteroidota bacterium]